MSQRPRIRVLVIDDEEDMCLYLRDLLERDGYGVTTCTEPRSALPEIKESRQQIVLLDLRMPEIDGVRLLHQIRAIDSDLCVIAMTAYPAVDTAVETLKHGAFDYLRKPFDVEQLRGVLARAVREKGLRVEGDDTINPLLGARIRGLRKQRSLTLKQLANKTSLSVSLISQIELGKSAASMSTLHKLATALAVKMTYFFETV
jgi:DNA-binding NtrC family response regulator